MYASGITSVPSPGAINYRTNRKRTAAGNRPQETGPGPERFSNDFLKEPISHIAPKKIVRNQFHEGYNYLTRANYLYLLRCVENYAQLLGKEFRHNPGDSNGAGIMNLYGELQVLVGDQIQINVHVNDKRLIFVLWDLYPWGEYNVYWLPVKFVENLPLPLQRLTISFLHQFRKSMKIGTVNSSDSFDFILEWQFETIDDYEDPNDRKAYGKYLKSYQKGSIHKLMEQIENKNYHRDLRKSLDRYKSASDYERELIGIMKEGLPFMGENVPNIFQYEYDFYWDEDSDDSPVSMDQQIMFIYDADDHVIDGFSSYVDDCYNNYYAIRPCATLALAPDTKETFGMEPFPKEFFDYMDKLNDFIRKNHYE